MLSLGTEQAAAVEGPAFVSFLFFNSYKAKNKLDPGHYFSGLCNIKVFSFLLSSHLSFSMQPICYFVILLNLVEFIHNFVFLLIVLIFMSSSLKV